jgi:N-acetylmuramic acid 6-phosphate etherase
VELYLAIDAGGTGTRAGLYDGRGRLVAETEAGPSNPIAYGLDTCLEILTQVGREVLAGQPDPLASVAAAVSGAREADLRETLAQRLYEIFHPTRAIVTDDLRPLLFANAGTDAGVLAIAGTGSSVLAQDADGRWVLVGGRGAILGDEGSAYRIAVEAMRAAAHAMDGLGPETRLVEELPVAAGVDNFTAMPGYAERASKQVVADLARVVCQLAEEGDAVAADCVKQQAGRLAEQVAVAAERLGLPSGICVYEHGGLFMGSLRYRDNFEEALLATMPDTEFRLPRFSGHRAVLEVARATELPSTVPTGVYPAAGIPLSPTETAPENRLNLDELPAEEIVRAMNREDMRAAEAVGRAAPAIAAVIEAAAEAIRSGGRIVYLGAGTSGRLGVLDASECPPTFGIEPERVVGLIAGGEKALRDSIEDSEDSTPKAEADMDAVAPTERDLVVGIAASGTTPYVRAGLERARSRGAKTVLLCCNPYCTDGADIVLTLDTGPEALPGSTRLKAGTATKMVLNMITTGAMALSGYVYDGLMVGMRPVNAKLRRRAARIISTLSEINPVEAEEYLDAAEGRIQVAVLMARLGLDADVARERFEEAGGNLRAALSEDA